MPATNLNRRSCQNPLRRGPGIRTDRWPGRPRSRERRAGWRLLSPAVWLVLVATLLGPAATQAYPPHPYHLIFGLARDEYGTPLRSDQVKVLLVATGGMKHAARIQPGLAIDVNYRLPVHLDAQHKPDLYRPNALPSGTGFKMYLVVGNSTNAAIVSATTPSNLGEPTKMTRIDLFLGTDANGDGIPDEFELAFLAALGSNLRLSDLNASLDLAHNGRTLLQEYLRGTYAFDLDSPLTARLVSYNDGAALLEFPVTPLQSYSVLGSTDLQQWSLLQFRLPGEGPAAPLRTNYSAAAAQTLQVQIVPPGPGTEAQFFRIGTR